MSSPKKETICDGTAPSKNEQVKENNTPSLTNSTENEATTTTITTTTTTTTPVTNQQKSEKKSTDINPCTIPMIDDGGTTTNDTKGITNCSVHDDKKSGSNKRSRPDEGRITENNKKLSSLTPRNKNRKKEDDNNKLEDVFDGAYVYGLHPGDRVLVKWDIIQSNDETKEEEKTIEYWWGATLLEYDGRTYIDEEEDGEDNNNNNDSGNGETVGPVAVHTLEYDEYPEGGFYEKSREDVIFASAFELLDMKSQDMLQYKRIGDDVISEYYDNTNDGMITFQQGVDGTSSNSLEDIVNTVLTNAMNKSIPNFDKLPASVQLAMAEKIGTKKQKLITLMEEFFKTTGKRIGTSRDMKLLLEQTMQD